MSTGVHFINSPNPEEEEDKFTMGDSLTANPMTPYHAGGSLGDASSSVGGFGPLSTSSEFEDNPRYIRGRNQNEEENHDSYSSSGSSETNDSYDDDDNDDDKGEDPPLSLEELLYSASSYHAIVRPVSATMMLAALASVYINTDESRELGEEQFASAYNVWHVDNSDSAGSSIGKNLLASVGNTFVMVCAIGAMTFGIVLLYKYRCMKVLIGYMIFSSASLLGLLGDYMFSIAIQIYQIPIDVISYSIIMYNFAIVGVTAIFYQKGIPSTITQFYLVCTSVILAWHLSHFDDWTAWTLLVMLALYDLCAVLSPCGPLKALVNLMQAKDAPDMPGLLYEAHLPAGTQRPGGGRQRSQKTRHEREDTKTNNYKTAPKRSTSAGKSSSNQGTERNNENNATENSTITDAATMSSTEIHGPHAFLPLAVAKVYRLPLVSRYTYGLSRRQRKQSMKRKKRENTLSSINESPLLCDNSAEEESTEEFYERNFSVAELVSEVEVEFPRNGGRIEAIEGSKNRFQVIGKNGEVKRDLFMNKKGKVFDVTNDNDDDSVYDEDPSSIRLGLGDFIFYSVLVSKAAMFSFTTFAVCMLVILAGLGATLVFLSVYHSALPALPISIFLGVIFYLLTRLLIEPWIELVLTVPVYV